jgi:HAD superfamily hydrolase (TIGR01490 family)
VSAKLQAPGANVAAFFDLDGTLVPLPSLERRFVRELLWRQGIPARNLAYWIAEALRLAPRGAAFVRQANKMYLRGVSVGATRAAAARITSIARLTFFPEAVNQVAWHATQEHRIVLVSGTLQVLAEYAAQALQEDLARRGIAVKIAVTATKLNAVQGRWTGRLVGEAVFGGAKSTAVEEFAAEHRLDLASCFAYGDSDHDRPMLQCVGNPVVVNGATALRHVAVRKGWRAIEWRMAEATCGEAEEATRRSAGRKAEILG